MQTKDLDHLIKSDPMAQGILHGSPVVRDAAPFEELDEMAKKMMEALIRGKCAIITPKIAAYTAGNSLVYCGPDINVSSLFPSLLQVPMKVATTIVIIYGHLHEELHHHTSHVISFVIEGEGWLFTEQYKCRAKPGDLVVIPRGVKHLFNCDEGKRMLIFATEISDRPIDHQKNFYR
jgi:mannose-6-phosphate isomerase-like protein (cupin superfamily)